MRRQNSEGVLTGTEKKKLQRNSESSQKVEDKKKTPQSRKVWYHRGQRKIVSRRPRV